MLDGSHGTLARRDNLGLVADGAAQLEANVGHLALHEAGFERAVLETVAEPTRRPMNERV